MAPSYFSDRKIRLVMRRKIRVEAVAALMLAASFVIAGDEASMDSATVERFAALALECVHQEYPNKIAHVLQSDENVAPPRELTPAFYGCFDWHSSVHGHWLASFATYLVTGKGR